MKLRDLLTLLRLRILEDAPAFSEKEHPNGWHPIHAAVLSGSYEIVELIVAQPGVEFTSGMKPRANGLSDQDFENLRGTELCQVTYHLAAFDSSPTPLHLACMIGHLGIIKLLLKTGASYDVPDDRSQIPRDYFDLQAGNVTSLKEYDSMQELWLKRNLSLQTLKQRVEAAFQMLRMGRYERLHRSVLRAL